MSIRHDRHHDWGYVSAMSLKVIPYGLAKHGAVLATRELGTAVGRSVQDSLSDGDALVLVFRDVEVASPPFLDELMKAVRAAIDPANGGRFVLLAEYNADVKECLEMVLERQKLVMAGVRRKDVELLGGDDRLKKTLAEARRLGEFTPPALAESLELKLPALHQRLKPLLESGVLVREDDTTAERGVRHKYRPAPIKTLVGSK